MKIGIIGAGNIGGNLTRRLTALGHDDSWRQQPDIPVYGLQAGVEAVTKALAEASRERTPGFRGQG